MEHDLWKVTAEMGRHQL